MIRILGPAKIRVSSGIVSVLGAEFRSGYEFEISKYRSYSLKAVSDAGIEVSLGDGSKIERADPFEEPLDDWITVADAVISECKLPCTVVVMGPVDAGKTSMAALLSNRALARGIPTAIIDADIGQADIGPPGFVSLAMPDSWTLWLREHSPVSMRFVGSIEPAPVAGRLLSLTYDLMREALERGAGVVVVDTDGWVEGWGALEHKVDLIRLLRADAVIVLGDPDLYETLHKVFPGLVLYARSPLVRISRSQLDRKTLRTANYRRFLEGAPVRALELNGLHVHGSCLFSSIPYNDPEVKGKVESIIGKPSPYVGKFPGGYCIVVESESPIESSTLRSLQKELSGDVLVLYTGGFKGVLVGLSDGLRDYPGIVEEVDLDTMKVMVRTYYEGPVRGLVFGRIRLVDYQDSAKRRVWI